MTTVAAFPRPVERRDPVWIPLKDGTRLAARLWLPVDAAARPVPAILEYLPYRRRDFTAERDALTHPYVAGHGYACVRVDMRGSGDSDGVLTDEYLPLEQDDAVEVIAWLAAQPWCTGRVGMIGHSWGGFNALQVAARRPPALGAIITSCSTDDRYRDDIHYMGGCLLLDNLRWASTMFAHNSRPPDPAVVGARWREMWLERLRGSGLWIDTWPPAVTWAEMTRAYEQGARTLWIVNVGDIKNTERSMEFFLDLAWHADRTDLNQPERFLHETAARDFGKEHAAAVAVILSRLQAVNFARKTEHLQWHLSMTPYQPTELNEAEIHARLAEWAASA